MLLLIIILVIFFSSIAIGFLSDRINILLDQEQLIIIICFHPYGVVYVNF
jgi:superfamily I DNA/RNA helicase